MPPLCKGRGTAVGGGRAVGNRKYAAKLRVRDDFSAILRLAITIESV